MPASFPRLDLPTPSSLSHVLTTLLSHSSSSLLPQQLERDGLTGEEEEAVCRRVLAQWVEQAGERLKRGNLSVEGVSWREWEEKEQALAPLDHQLLTRLTNLTRTVDELTESAVLSRRELPTRRAEALRAREEVVDSLREREDEGRQRQRKAGFQDAEEDKGMVVDLERREEVGQTLQRSLEQADLLAESLPSQVAAVREQHDLVVQLRSMPP
ncbi:hypothetical protein BDZ90DRAFT_234263 [Jaminaea rosea]|uniref:Uncharacterized protein n=1 Tax=Jaminaea rosea TaxID=1569628 RepID=A0A316UJJ2_9BASI|nr:hypothetical protein BDZ90DRAFT_234263 [Jaminaea rosea]PWN25446.1 hypothetical protein BDZ90DRAFT_234263 [Jaminaea rosea]